MPNSSLAQRGGNKEGQSWGGALRSSPRRRGVLPFPTGPWTFNHLLKLTRRDLHCLLCQHRGWNSGCVQVPPKVSPGILWNLSFSTATVNSGSSKTGVVTKAQTWTCWPEAGVLSKQLWSKAGIRVSPLEGCTSICTQISLQPGEEAVLTNLIWGLGGQKGSGTHPSAQIFYCPHLRLFWKMPSEIPRHRPL